MTVATFLVCAVTAFFTHRTAHGRTPDERNAYLAGEKAGAEAPQNAKLLTAAGLHIIAQQRFAKEGAGKQMTWNDAFARGYTDGFNKSHPRAQTQRRAVGAAVVTFCYAACPECGFAKLEVTDER